MVERSRGDYRKLWVTGSGQVMAWTHDAEKCEGRPCVVHNPSDHHMREWPTYYRRDRGITERLCSHGVGHPDPDDLAGFPHDEHRGIHGCDGCCNPDYVEDSDE